MGKIIAVLVILLLALALGGIITCVAVGIRTVYIEVPLRQNIERAVEVQALENKFVHVESVAFGGAGAGGLGAPVIKANSSTQFLSLVPENEPIYTAFSFGEYRERRDPYSCGLTYWAFIENRAGLVQYQDLYHGGHVVQGHTKSICSHYTGTGIVFRYSEVLWFEATEIQSKALDRGYKVTIER